ncbi:MAG TPA: hypothetical protein VK184_21240 [Nostocaceae cyanobacterium]|nr:hypothetical protein [Nostocaceae cyanobacterium]
MFARITDSQGNLVTIVDWQIVTINNEKLDRFVDRNGNLYFERPHSNLLVNNDTNTDIMSCLQEEAKRLYKLDGLVVEIGRTN